KGCNTLIPPLRCHIESIIDYLVSSYEPSSTAKEINQYYALCEEYKTDDHFLGNLETFTRLGELSYSTSGPCEKICNFCVELLARYPTKGDILLSSLELLTGTEKGDLTLKSMRLVGHYLNNANLLEIVQKY